MKTTITQRALVLGCLAIISMYGYAAADENVPVASLDNRAAYMTDGQAATQVVPDFELKTPEKGLGRTVGATILACIAAPWGTVTATIMTATGLGMIYDALVPERIEEQENDAVVVFAANENE